MFLVFCFVFFYVDIDLGHSILTATKMVKHRKIFCKGWFWQIEIISGAFPADNIFL